jgi:hypothetical protein
MFRACSMATVGSYQLYTWQVVSVMQVMWLHETYQLQSAELSWRWFSWWLLSCLDLCKEGLWQKWRWWPAGWKDRRNDRWLDGKKVDVLMDRRKEERCPNCWKDRYTSEESVVEEPTESEMNVRWQLVSFMQPHNLHETYQLPRVQLTADNSWRWA